jgi:hypothetical protein
MTSINDTFVKAKKYLNDNKITCDINILSAVCNLASSTQSKTEMYNMLISTHPHTIVNQILSTVSIIQKNKPYNNIYTDAYKSATSVL